MGIIPKLLPFRRSPRLCSSPTHRPNHEQAVSVKCLAVFELVHGARVHFFKCSITFKLVKILVKHIDMKNQKLISLHFGYIFHVTKITSFLDISQI